MTFAEKQGEHNARLGSLEDSRLQLHDDLREIRDLIRQGQQLTRPPVQDANALAMHNLADVLRRQVEAQAAKPTIGAEIAHALATHASNNKGGNAVLWLALGAVLMAAIFLAWGNLT